VAKSIAAKGLKKSDEVTFSQMYLSTVFQFYNATRS